MKAYIKYMFICLLSLNIAKLEYTWQDTAKKITIPLNKDNCIIAERNHVKIIVKIGYFQKDTQVPKLVLELGKLIPPEILYDKYHRFKTSVNRESGCIITVTITLHPTDDKKSAFVIYANKSLFTELLNTYSLETNFQVYPTLYWSSENIMPYMSQKLSCLIPENMVSLDVWERINLTVSNTEDILHRRSTIRGPEIIMQFLLLSYKYEANCKYKDIVLKKKLFTTISEVYKSSSLNNKGRYIRVVAAFVLGISFILGMYMLIVDQLAMRSIRSVQFHLIRSEITRKKLTEEVKKLRLH